MFIRLLHAVLLKQLNESNKIVMLYGPRQTGKTTLLKLLVEKFKGAVSWANGDLKNIQEAFSSQNLERLKEMVDDADLLIIDEAQNIPNIGINLKILYDEIPDLKIIATGSSSIELANVTKEALTGRTATFRLYPLSLEELRTQYSVFDLKQQLPGFLVYGLYPEVVMLTGISAKRQHLQEIVSGYLYKDILQLANIRHSDKIHRLLQLLAFQIGSLVSVNELAQKLSLNHETVNNYLDLLENGFIIQRLSGLSNNPRNEISKMDKFYFTDVGIRNAVIENFSDVTLRNDIGALWENFIFIERQKFLSNHGMHGKSYFWRRYSGAEINLIEQRDGLYHAFEIKWQVKNAKIPASFKQDYQDSTFQVINRENFPSFVMKNP
jgi:hypothetical protein